MDQEPKSSSSISPKFWFVIISVVAGLSGLVLLSIRWWFHYASHTLLWDEQQTTTVTLSAMAIPFAVLVVFGLRKINSMSGSLSAEAKQSATVSLVMQPLAWSLIFVAYTLYQNREQWHLQSAVSYSVGVLAALILLWSYFLEIKNAKGKMQIFSALSWLIMIAYFAYSFGWGKDGVFK